MELAWYWLLVGAIGGWYAHDKWQEWRKEQDARIDALQRGVPVALPEPKPHELRQARAMAMAFQEFGVGVPVLSKSA